MTEGAGLPSALHLLLGDDQGGEQAQAGAGGEDQQAALDQLGGQLLVGALPLHVDADHQAHAPGGAQAWQVQ